MGLFIILGGKQTLKNTKLIKLKIKIELIKKILQ